MGSLGSERRGQHSPLCITVQGELFGGLNDHALVPSAEKVATNAFQGDAVRDARILREAITLMIGKREFATRIGREIHTLAQNGVVIPVFVKGSTVLVRAKNFGGRSVARRLGEPQIEIEKNTVDETRLGHMAHE